MDLLLLYTLQALITHQTIETQINSHSIRNFYWLLTVISNVEEVLQYVACNISTKNLASVYKYHWRCATFTRLKLE